MRFDAWLDEFNRLRLPRAPLPTRKRWRDYHAAGYTPAAAIAEERSLVDAEFAPLWAIPIPF